MKLWSIAIGLAWLISVLADTEIRNFRLPLPPSSPSSRLHEDTLQLDSSARKFTVTLSDEEPNALIRLDLNAAVRDWTVRASWPGSSPIKLNMTLTSTANPSIILLHLSSTQLTPHFPHPLLSNIRSPNPPSHNASIVKPRSPGQYATTLDIVYEPLLLGFIPASTLPTIYWVIGAAALSAMAVPLFVWFVEGVAGGDQAQDGAERLAGLGIGVKVKGE